MLRIVVVLALFAQVAHAQRAPDMATLDRGDGISKIGLDIGFTALKQPPSPYDAALRFELWGQYISKIGLGFYGALPLTQSLGAQPPPVNNATALGDLDLGALYVISGETAGVVFRAGAGIPIANDGADPALTRFAGALPRLTDLALATHDWYARVSVSPLLYAHRFFLRADVGFDIDISGNDYHFLRLNLGAGVDAGIVAFALEFVNSITFGTSPRAEDRIFDTLALTVRFNGEHFQPFLSAGIPLDQARRDSTTVFVAGGLQVAF